MNPALQIGLIAALVAALSQGPPPSPRPRVVIVSVDGLWANDLARAESAGLRLPVLDSLRRAGALAAGVVGSLPSVTYPSHTTIITGVRPARHGVFANRRPWVPTDTGAMAQAWYWEGDWIRVPSVIDAARARGLRVAAVFWPVTADDPDISYNLPEVWDPRPVDERTSELEVIRRRGAGWVLDSLGAPATGSASDSLRAAWAAAVIRRWDPDLTLLHLIDLDGAKHRHGPWHDSVAATLATVDRRLGLVVAAASRSRPTTVIITSDHGFFGYHHQFRPGVLLARAGLVTVDTSGRVTDWRAAAHTSGGSAALIARDAGDAGLVRRIRAAIPDSFVGPGRPIRAVWPRDSIAALGGDPRAAWVLDLNEGYYSQPGYWGEVLWAANGGGHGYDPRRPALHAFFLAAGPGTRPGWKLPVIRQTDIAPTVARLLGFRLDGVEGRPVF